MLMKAKKEGLVPLSKWAYKRHLNTQPFNDKIYTSEKEAYVAGFCKDIIEEKKPAAAPDLGEPDCHHVRFYDAHVVLDEPLWWLWRPRS